ncbi:unnamed protein product, partial [Mesorhabditis belari]|uniref:Uncharacterized protein n=1 Tax=Mesorhabditis belari TaxID=2138241 RepID=A0AAF3J3I3_9BILA
MDRAFQTFRQRPYSSAIELLHEIRSICENAFDLHQSRDDPVNGVAKDVHDFIHELFEEQDRLKNGGENGFEGEENFDTFPQNPSTSKESNEHLVTANVTPTNAQQINLLLLNEVLQQRQMTAELGVRLIQILAAQNETNKPIQQVGNLGTTTSTGKRKLCWDQHSDSDEEDIVENNGN